MGEGKQYLEKAGSTSVGGEPRGEGRVGGGGGVGGGTWGEEGHCGTGTE